jgi:methionyl-tRNA formyltransferase
VRVVFAGTPDAALPALEAVVASPHDLVAVVTRPDAPSGRGRRLTPPPVKEAALAHGLPVAQPRSLVDPGVHSRDPE